MNERMQEKERQYASQFEQRRCLHTSTQIELFIFNGPESSFAEKGVGFEALKS